MALNAAAKAQAFAHRLVEFAAYDKCIQFFNERQIDFDRANAMGWSVLMSVCACGRDDLVGFTVDRTTAVDCATISNKTTVLHLTAMSRNTRVMEELVASAERQQKMRKIVDQPNAHADTALMMACVAKNEVAVRHLLALGARMDLVNASGLNALMCAARIGQDPRSGALSATEMMERSAVIVQALLANGACANVVEKRGGNTALHLAVLSENVDAVKSLIQFAKSIDLTVQNKVGKTALDLSDEILGDTAEEIKLLLNEKWSRHTIEVAQRSAQLEQELLKLAVEDDGRALDHTGVRRTEKKKTKRTKKNRHFVHTMSKDVPKVLSPAWNKEKGDENTETNENVALLPVLKDAKAVETAHADVKNSEDGDASDDGDWHSVLSKKHRRNELGNGYVNIQVKENAFNNLTHTTKLKSRTDAPEPLSLPTTQSVCPKVFKAVLPAPVVATSPWSMQLTPKATNATALPSSRSQELSEDEKWTSSTSNTCYNVLNECFHRTFPVATELEIDVEKFLIASSLSDRELEPDNSLSISQVEALQEAHWQAYHYLNEKKIELNRVLEAQRVEAQYALQQELMQMK